ncbi:MAG TPA: non-ribosomal peptide synthetase, partial [Acidobacteria bacterium]|nr:non-ribosomal peptide synthetase [Acidobacteriota bacterium]
RRHEILRTVFEADQGKPVQRILPGAPFPFPVVDLAGLPAAIRTAEMARLEAEDHNRPFDLARGPLFRATLLAAGPREHVALLNLHHAVADGWSWVVLVREIATLYPAFAAGLPAPLPALPLQYADFAAWQRAHLQGETLESELGYWREQLAGAPPPLRLPTDRPRTAGIGFTAGGVQRRFPAPLGRDLQALAGREGATLFMLLLAAWTTWLYRATGEEDLLAGVPIANRTHSEIEGLIGFFVNTLVMRTTLSGGESFLSLLARVREVARGAYVHQDLPLETVLQAVHPGAGQPFSVMFQVQNLPDPRLEFSGLTLRASRAGLNSQLATEIFDLCLVLEPGEEGIDALVIYNARLFEAATIERQLAQLEVLLTAVAAAPGRTLDELPLAGAAEVAQVLAWATEKPVAPELPVHLAFARQARATPGAVALVAGDDGEVEITYAELAQQVHRLAHHLRGLGVRPEMPVALSLERSPAMITALFAILQAGGAYVPMDPGLPRERLDFLLADSGAPVLLTERRLLGAFGEAALAGVRAVCLDEEGDRIAACSAEAPDEAPRFEGLAYVIYTSGSTGKPKGVMVAHRSLASYIAGDCLEYGIGAADRVLQFASISFDNSAEEIYPVLTTGGTLVLRSDAMMRSSAAFLAACRARRITLLTLPTAWWHVLAADLAEGLDWPPGLDRVIIGGERPLPERLEAWRRALGTRVHLWNTYGPTECTIGATLGDLAPWLGSSDGLREAPLGRPFAGYRAYVLDARQEPLPVGLPGELCLGGAGVARGYLGRPDLTAERFLPDPFAADLGEPGGRLYRTGDLARHLSDGRLEHLGRLDHQVKVRGFRIELGEIEQALLAHPGVAQAVVVARSDRGSAHLVAWFVPAAGAAPSSAELSEHLRRTLPDYMVPSAFAALAELPLSPNRKVDRGALMQREVVRPAVAAGGAPLAPRGALEETLADIWRKVLGIEQIGVDESFFEAGGHSLRLVQVQAGILDALGIEVPIVELFRHPTIASLASHLGGVPAAVAPAPVPVPVAGDTDVAIIAMAARLPGAPDLDRFWHLLRDGVEAISRLTGAQLLDAGVDAAAQAHPGFVSAEPLLEGIDRFDAAFFGLSPLEAQVLDPQQRLFLEIAWACMESAGYDTERYPGRVGVFAGESFGAYALNLLSHPGLRETLDPLTLAASIVNDYLATRISYKLGLRGPGVSVQTACSTSLVAIHMARQSLLTGECEMALAGGVTLRVPQGSGYRYLEGGIASPDGHCRAFDASARGTVFGSGAGVVLLKRLADALRDGDTIHAVLKGSAINNDGSLKVGFTAPSVDGQAEVIAAAQQAAGVSPDSVTYVEAHGTATPLGDPIEIAALTRAFRRGTGRTGFCALGSVKTNVGHLDAAAGVTGLIKTVLALKHRQIPPSLHFQSPNPQIDFAASPFYVNARLADWTAGPGPRRAGVSSFGIGGTNAHAVLEEAPPAAPSASSRRRQILLLSARTPAALDEATGNLADFLAGHPEANLADVAWTLQVGRKAFEHRRALVCESVEDAVAVLRDAAGSGRVLTRRLEAGRRSAAFLFPGQGAQHLDMGRELYEKEPVFRAEVESCAQRLLPHLGCDLREILYPPAECRAEAACELRQTRFAQPALFVVELALARLWISWGVRPEAMLGHSLGEYVAACLAGVFSLPDALELVACRGALMQELPPGAMLSVELPESALRAELAPFPALSIAAINAPSSCVASGPEPDIATLEARLAAQAVQVRRLHTSHAFHSAMTDPVVAAFAERVARAAPQPPGIPFVSNLTGTWITVAQATDPGYWACHLRETVRFSDGIATLLAGTRAVLLEIGPGRGLASLARKQHNPVERPAPISSLHREGDTEPDSAVLLGALTRLWLSGVEVDWTGVHTGERRRRIPLPTYPFQRQRHWIDPGSAGLPRPTTPVALLVQGEAAVDPAWSAGLEARGWRVVTLDAGQARPEALDELLATLDRSAVEPPLRGGPSVSVSAQARPWIDTPYKQPDTEIEHRLAGIWGSLLGIDRVGIHDDFFELGGHSVLATLLISRVREAFGREVPLETVFSAPTVARFAAFLAAAEELEAARIPRQPEADSYPLSFAQQRLWLIDQMEAESPFYNMAAAVRLVGSLRVDCLRCAVAEIVRRHESLRTIFTSVNGEPRQVIQPPYAVEFPLIDLAGIAGRELIAARLVQEWAGASFDLSRGPLSRGRLVRLEQEEHVLLWTMHHIVADGWSIEVLIRELTILYGGLIRGTPAYVPDLPVQYRDFAVWQRQLLQTNTLAELRSYWVRQLAGAPTLLRLAADRSRPARQSFRGGNLVVSIPSELGLRILDLADREESTVFMTLLSTFAVLLHFSSGQDELLVGSPFGARHRAEIEGLIGLFVNTLPLRIDLSGAPTFRELLARVRRTVLGALSHQHLPLDQLVEELQPERSTGYNPLFQVSFNLIEGGLAQPLAMSGLEIIPFPRADEFTQFDLSLTVLRRERDLTATFQYSTDLFDALTIAWMGEDLRRVLDEVATEPDIPLRHLGEILAAADRERRAALAEELRRAHRESFGLRRRQVVALLENA